MRYTIHNQLRNKLKFTFWIITLGMNFKIWEGIMPSREWVLISNIVEDKGEK